jgi:hypothetical protein
VRHWVLVQSVGIMATSSFDILERPDRRTAMVTCDLALVPVVADSARGL